VKAKTRNEIEGKVISFYKEKTESPCFREVFEQWITEKESYGEVRPSTVLRYRTEFARCFPADESFCKVPLCEMTDVILKDFIKRQIFEKRLTKKTVGLLNILLNGVFKYAKEHEYTNYSISTFMADLHLPKNIFTKKVKNQALEVFNDAEAEQIISYLLSEPTSVNALVNFGLALCFFTGLRVGEVSSLKAEDNIVPGKLFVSRTESTSWSAEKGQRITYVSDFPKTESGVREILLPDEGQRILNDIKETSKQREYLFMKNGKRITERMFGYYLGKACRAVNIEPRPTHRIRKTFISKLLSQAVDSALVARMAGHSNITTTQTYYHRVISTEEAQYNMINNALKYVG